MRDMRINLIFEGTSEIMRLFIAREAVDTHLDVAGDLVDPRTSGKQKFRALLRAAAFYAWWYPSRWLGWGRWPRYSEFGPLASHIRFVERRSRKLARTLFHCMVRFGPKLEKRQLVLGRLVEIGAELLAMTAVCARALQEGQGRQDGQGGQGGPMQLADVFCLHARRRVDDRFRAVWANDDTATYRLAQRVLKGEHSWLERGIV